MSANFFIRDENGRKRAVDFLTALNIGKPWQVTIAPLRKKRSTDQNSLYWKWCGIVADETGNTADDVHEFAKSRFLPKHFVTINDETRETRKTTTKLSTKDMSEFMTKFSAWAESEMGIALPHPEDLGR